MEFIANLFPYLHLAILIAGVFLLVFVKRKYPKVRNFELIIVFILFFILNSNFKRGEINKKFL